MGGRQKFASGLVAVAILASALSACGGSSDSSGSEAEPSRQFIKQGSQNKIATFGKEADSGEREAASVVLDESLEARAARDFASQCETLTAKSRKEIEAWGALHAGKKECAAGLESESQGAPASVFANTLSGEVDALRVDGQRAYALYRGTDGKNYAMPMALEGGEWKVGDVATIELP